MRKSLSLDGTKSSLVMRCKLKNKDNKNIEVNWVFNGSSITLDGCTFNSKSIVRDKMVGTLKVDGEYFDITIENPLAFTELGNEHITIFGRMWQHDSIAVLLNHEILREFVNVKKLSVWGDNVVKGNTIDLSKLDKLASITYNLDENFYTIPPSLNGAALVYSPNACVLYDMSNAPLLKEVHASPKENTDIATLTCQETLELLKMNFAQGLTGDIGNFSNYSRLKTLALCAITNDSIPTHIVPDMYGDITKLPKSITKFVIGNQPNISFENVDGTKKLFDKIDVWNSKNYYMSKEILLKVVKALSLSEIGSESKICLYGKVPANADAEYAEYTSAIDSIKSRTSNVSISDVYSEVENYNI